MDEEVSWYRSVKASEKKYGAPAHVQLAIMYQESHFASDAKPPREKLFGVVPWFRPTTAYGFAQVKDATWDWYQLKTGNYSADRDDFDDILTSLKSVQVLTNQMLIISIWLIMKVMADLIKNRTRESLG